MLCRYSDVRGCVGVFVGVMYAWVSCMCVMSSGPLYIHSIVTCSTCMSPPLRVCVCVCAYMCVCVCVRACVRVCVHMFIVKERAPYITFACQSSFHNIFSLYTLSPHTGAYAGLFIGCYVHVL